MNWLVDWPAAEFPEGTGFTYDPWVDGDTLSLNSTGAEFWQDITADGLAAVVPPPVPTPLFPSAESQWKFSPSGEFVVYCELENTTLYRMPSRVVIAVLANKVEVCPYIRWKDDSTAFSLVTDLGQVFVWNTTNGEYESIGEAWSHSPASWSPDGSKLVTMWQPEGWVDYELRILYLDGRPANRTGIVIDFGRNQWFPTFIHWVTDDVIGDFFAGSAYRYDLFYSANSGELLMTNWVTIGADQVPYGQFPFISPDKAWIALDHNEYPEGLNDLNSYLLFETDTYKDFLLSDDPELYLEYLGWSDDSSRFYLISRPASIDAQPSSTIPRGLTALDPSSLSFIPIVPEAIYAELNSDESAAFVLVPDDAGGLRGVLYTTTGEKIADLTTITDPLIYRFPGQGLLLPAAWSKSGDLVLFFDQWGGLWIAHSTGEFDKIAENFELDLDESEMIQIDWSPDETHVLIRIDTRAWVLAVP